MAETPQSGARNLRGLDSSNAPSNTLDSPVGAGSGGAVEVVRSEERLHVGTDIKITGRAVLRKYIVTETVTQTFQVRHEEVRLDYEPATNSGAPADREVFSDRVVELVLHREVPVVQMEIVATERVLLHVDTVTDHVEVSTGVRKEQVDLKVLDA